jgi:hypothetical protein
MLGSAWSVLTNLNIFWWCFERTIDWIQSWSKDLDTHRPKLPGSPADQNNVEHQRRKIRFIKYHILTSRHCTDNIKFFTFDIPTSRYCNTILYSISNKTSISNTNRVYKEGRNCFGISYPILQVFLWYQHNIEYTKRIVLERPQYCTRYRIRYRFWNIIFSSKTGASVPRLLIAMKIVKWTFTITVITWTKIFLLGTESAVPCCPIWTHYTLLEWYARFNGHDYRRS